MFQVFVSFSVLNGFLDVKLLRGICNFVIVSMLLVLSGTEYIKKRFYFKLVVLKLWVYNFLTLF